MPQSLDYLRETASQTAGPFVHIGLAPAAAGFDIFDTELGKDIAGPNAKGERIRVEGTVIDGTGSPVKDVLLEIWQANADGIYAHPEGGAVEEGFRGWGRVISDFETGAWAFETVKPGATAGREGRTQAPHLNIWIVARGINIGLNTRMYFADEAEANACDEHLRGAGIIVRKVAGYGLPHCLRITVGDESACRRVAHAVAQFKGVA